MSTTTRSDRSEQTYTYRRALVRELDASDWGTALQSLEQAKKHAAAAGDHRLFRELGQAIDALDRARVRMNHVADAARKLVIRHEKSEKGA